LVSADVTTSQDAAKSSSLSKQSPDDEPEDEEAHAKEDDAQGETEAGNKRPAPVISCLPPIVTFDDNEAKKLSSELDELYFYRTGRRRGAKTDDGGKPGKAYFLILSLIYSAHMPRLLIDILLSRPSSISL
jgi:hypothetical protein